MRLIDLLPDFYEKNVTMQTLQEILSGVTDELEEKLSSIISECFVMTAGSLLSRYEQLFGLEVDISKSDEFRKERITAKVSGTGTTTKQMIIETASRYSNGQAEVTEDNANSSFTIKFIGTEEHVSVWIAGQMGMGQGVHLLEQIYGRASGYRWSQT